MKEQDRKRSLVPVLGNIVLLVAGLTMALGLAEMLMRAFPNLLPPDVRVNPPARRIKALIDDSYDLRQSDGDLFYYMRGKIAPLPPDQDKVVAHIHMITDADGFRNSPSEQATYDIVALGDSFTKASGVAAPWTQKLAEYSGSDVLNLGEVGFGPQDELKVLRQYGLKKQPEWVILAYFEGNDLYDAASYEQANPFILFRFGRYILNKGMEAWQAKSSNDDQVEAATTYRYPMTVSVHNKDLQMVFFSYYISWLSVNRQAMEASHDYRIAGRAILKMQQLSEAGGSQFLLVYVPSKEHIYLPYLKDADTLQSVFADVPTIELDPAGYLQFTDEKATPELTRDHMDDQAGLLADFAEENNIRFLDLTPIFREQASTGAELYYPFDTHWNQTGHDLAAQSINKYIEQVPSTSSGSFGQ